MVELSPYLGKVLGVDVQIHWTLLLLLLYVLYVGIATGNLYYFAVWVLLFACVLVHELTHSVTSKRNGIKVKKIVLYPLGGGSIIDFENVTPELEYKISIVGPLASLLLAALFGLAVIFMPAGTAKALVQLLFLLNLFLGVFNLLPWLPLDGGRALRSYLQKSMGFLDATKLSVKVSNAVTALFIAGTVVYVALIPGTFTYKYFVVLIDLIVAMFVYSGARAELSGAYLKTRTAKLLVGSATSRSFVVVKKGYSVQRLYGSMLKHHTHLALYKDSGRVMAVTELTLDNKTVSGGTLRTVGQLGSEIPQVRLGDSLYGAVQRMQLNDTGTAAVMRNGNIVGVLLARHAEAVMALYLSKGGRGSKLA